MSNATAAHSPAASQAARLGRGLRLLAACAVAANLAACAQQPKTMYSWQGYEPSVYAYLKHDGIDYAAQAQELEKYAEIARSSNAALPPGFRAHLGMLYLKMGEDARAMEQLQGETLAFPESSPFMDFLLRHARSAAFAEARASKTAAPVAAQRSN